MNGVQSLANPRKRSTHKLRNIEEALLSIVSMKYSYIKTKAVLEMMLPFCFHKFPYGRQICSDPSVDLRPELSFVFVCFVVCFL